MTFLESLPQAMKANVVLSSIDITGQTMMRNRERLATIYQARRPGLNDDLATKAVDIALEILALLATDADENARTAEAE
ncbi:hypothetical protein [Paraburkholderia sp. MM6662-R1]|uniref:hypothetical protein n=1 Tax=Paraburkholderia sp. MM6662-R1 TaxID=2991066 RepID=UPI003D1BAFD9